MSWITLTTADVLEQFNETERQAYQDAQGEDTMAGLISKVCTEVQGYVRKRYEVGAAGTIPDELESAAVALIRYRFLNSLPIKSLMTEQRVKEKEDALTLLRDVAKGNFAIAGTFKPADDESNTLSPSISERTRTHTRDNQDGI